MQDIKQSLIDELKKRVQDKILEPSNAELLIKLINNAESSDEAINIAALGTTYKRTGLHFDKRLENPTDHINYFKKNEKLSFHTDDTKPVNKLIIGDNYQALQNLLIQYKGQIDVIYIDPPYGKDSMGEFAKTNYTNSITRDNLLSMLYPRLILAKQLLSDEGVIFCSIDDKNQAYVKCLFDEVFGEENFVANCIWKSTPGSNTGNELKTVTEYILVYARYLEDFSVSSIIVDCGDQYKFEDVHVERRGKYTLNKLDRRMTGQHYSDALNYAIELPNGNKLYPGDGFEKQEHWNWRWSKEKVEWGIKNDFIVFKEIKGKWSIYFKQYYKVDNNDNLIQRSLSYQNLIEGEGISSARGTQEVMSLFNDKSFDYPKPINLLKYILDLHISKSALILDFFAGSGTTGHAVLDLNKQDGGNRSFILCQLNEKTEKNPNGIAYDVTSKRLKRIMTGQCYDGTKDFPWLKDNEPYGGNLDVYEIDSVTNFNNIQGQTPFDVIDETLYGQEKFKTIKEKIEWVCSNFEKTQKELD